MARVILAAGRQADEPYTVVQFGRRVYSAEELCYLLVQSAQILDAHIMDPALVDWLSQQCGLPELSERLRPLLGRERSLSEFVAAILDYIGFLSEDRTEQARRLVADGQGAEYYARRIRRAEYLAGNAQPWQAMAEFDAILRDLPEPEKETRTRALCGKGRVLASLFFFRAAAECYEQAWALNGDRETYLKYLAAMRLELPDEEYLSFIAEHPEASGASLELEKAVDRCEREFAQTGAGRSVDNLRQYKKDGMDTNYEIALHQAIQEIKSEYVRTAAPEV